MTDTSSFTNADLVAAAARAPSSHNTQPWWFRDLGTAIELHADRTRALPVNDPHDRELTISCGSALHHLCLAVTASGAGAETAVLPSDDVDHLATVAIVPGTPDASAADPAALEDLLTARHTHRGPFGPTPVADDLADRLDAVVESYGARLRWVPPGEERDAVAALVAKGDRVQFADRSWRRELASWMHPRRRGDGLTVGMVTGAVTRSIVAHLDLGKSTASKDEAITREAPLVGVLTTDRDGVVDWLVAGHSLGHLLLVAAAEGVQAGYANQPCQVAELRPQLRRALGLEGQPQLVIRLGVPPSTPTASPRRPVADVLAQG